MSKRTLKKRFFSKELKIKQNTSKIEADFQMKFDFRLGWSFFKVKKLVSRSARSQSWLCSFLKVEIYFIFTVELCLATIPLIQQCRYYSHFLIYRTP